MIAVDTLIESSKFIYGSYSCLKRDIVHKDLSKDTRDLNVIIGVRGRSNFLPVCIKYLKEAIKNSTLKVVITIVEQDSVSHYRAQCKSLGVGYIFIPNIIIKKGESYNRSFCFNVGYLLATQSTWYLFHDIDILVDGSFFSNISTYLAKNPKWLQTYTHKRVLLLNPGITEEIVKSTGLIDLKAVKDYKEAQAGSTGGSIIVRNDVFLDVGGFDPEFFYGYGPEDSFFWSKLEVCTKPTGIMEGHFCGGGVFADDPAIEVYHMHHEPMWYTNPDEGGMLRIRESFWKYSYEDKMKLIQDKRSTLKDATILVVSA